MNNMENTNNQPSQISSNLEEPLAISGSKDNAPQYLDHLEKTATSAKLGYYLWISRFFVLAAVVSMSFLVLASLALFRLAPRVTVEPLLLVKNSESDNLVSNESISFDMNSKDILMKMYIKQYVTLRNAIIHDKDEMRVRWMSGGMVSFLSSPKVYNEFGAPLAEKWESIIKQSSSREVDITSVVRQGGDKSAVWKVDFKTYDLGGDRADSEGVKVKYWTASVTARFIPERSFSFYRLINPLGFTVTRYSQTEVNIF